MIEIIRTKLPTLLRSIMVTFCFLAPIIGYSAEYYWEFQGTNTWRSTSPVETCQSYFDWQEANYNASHGDDAKLYNFQVEASPYHSAIFHCKYSLALPHGTFEPVGQVNRYGDGCPTGKIYNADLGICMDGPLFCESNPNIGNPVNLLTGSKRQRFLDLQVGDIALVRGYRQSGENASWFFNLQESLVPLQISGKSYFIHRHMGREDYLEQQSSECWHSAGSPCYQIESDGSTHTLIIGSEKKQFDQHGRLTQIANLAGRVTTFTYTASTVELARDNKTLILTLDAEERISAASGGGNSVAYTYNASGMISHAVWQDGRDDYYTYSGSNNNRLSGLGTNGELYAHWEYDNQNRVVLSERNGGAERITFDYQPNAVEVTNALGRKTVYRYAPVASINRLVAVEGIETPSCLGATRELHYYPNGDIEAEVNAKGHITRHFYNERHLEIQRIEGFGTEEQRVFITHWHPTLNLKSWVVSEVSAHEFIYSQNDRLIEKNIYSTEDDTDGDGLMDYIEARYFGTLNYSSTAGLDSDGDGLPDEWEMEHLPSLFEDSQGDFDQDGLTNLQEFQSALDPADGISDTDGDNLPDSWELQYFGDLSQSANDDFDNDGFNNLAEFQAGTDPTANSNHLDPNSTHADMLLSNNNHTVSNSGTSARSSAAANPLSPGNKYYWELSMTGTSSTSYSMIGISSDPELDSYLGSSEGYGWHSHSDGYNPRYFHAAAAIEHTVDYSAGDRLMIAFDPGAGKLWFGKNGVWNEGGDPGAGIGAQFSDISGLQFPVVSARRGAAVTVYFKPDLFLYTPPSGFAISEP